MTRKHVSSLVATLGLPAPDGRLEIEPAEDVFGSPYAVTEAAVASIATAVWAVDVLDAARSGRDPERATVSGRHAAAAFHSERLLSVPSLTEEALWDPIAGNYPTADGWVRLHTNLPAHRRAALSVLGTPADRDAVAETLLDWKAAAVEAAVVDAGGVAAAMRTRAEWRNHPQGRSLATQPLLDLRETASGSGVGAGRFLDGVRVLDLTRVIAGPVAGRFLASFGADVVRIDGPLEDGLLVEIDTGFGKRRTSLDLRAAADRHAFEALVAEADVLIEAFRPGALDALGHDVESLQRIRPGLVTGHLSAFGEFGPWGSRRGFDSVTQVACGVAHACGFDEASGPLALPAQALDHASGYLLAAGVVCGLTRRADSGRGQRVSTSLARTADWLESLGTRPGRPAGKVDPSSVEDLMATRTDTTWGSVRHLRAVGRIGHRDAAWVLPPAPRDEHRPR